MSLENIVWFILWVIGGILAIKLTKLAIKQFFEYVNDYQKEDLR